MEEVLLVPHPHSLRPSSGSHMTWLAKEISKTIRISTTIRLRINKHDNDTGNKKWEEIVVIFFESNIWSNNKHE